MQSTNEASQQNLMLSSIVICIEFMVLGLIGDMVKHMGLIGDMVKCILIILCLQVAGTDQC